MIFSLCYVIAGNCSFVKEDVYLEIDSKSDAIKTNGKQSMVVGSQAECLALCQQTAACRVWNYVTTKYEGAKYHKHCYLMREYATSSTVAGINSGPRYPCNGKHEV